MNTWEVKVNMGTKPVLRFREDGTFKIVQIADLHVEEEGQEDARTFAVSKQFPSRNDQISSCLPAMQ